MILSAKEKLQEPTADTLDRTMMDLENQVKLLSDEIANNAQKIDRIRENLSSD